MGLFDNLEMEYKNIKPSTGDQFQTKSLGCTLGRFKIDEEGNLFKRLSDAWYSYPHEGYFEFHDGVDNYEAWFTGGKITNIKKK